MNFNFQFFKKIRGLRLLKDPLKKQQALDILAKVIEVKTLIPKAKKLIETMLDSQWIDAEFEADYKIAQLTINGNFDLVFTEDSDFIVYGMPLIIFKYSRGEGQLYSIDNNFNMNSPKMGNSIFESWFLFQNFCVLCGCDYFKMNGIAIQSARKICKTNEKFNDWIDKQTCENINKIKKALEIFNLRDN